MTAATLASPRIWAGESLEDHDPVPLPDFLLGHARDLGDKPALVDGPSGRTLSYRQLADGVERVAAGLAAGLDVLDRAVGGRPGPAVVHQGRGLAGGVGAGDDVHDGLLSGR